MKVLHIVGDSKFGGGAVVIVQLARLAVDLGWETQVLTTDPIFQSELREREIGIVDLDVIRREIRPTRDLAGLWRLVGFLRQNRYTIVHTHTSKAGIVGRLAARLAGVPVVVHTAHGFAFHERSPRSVVRACALAERIAGIWCDRIITVSRFHRSWAIELGIAKTPKVIAIPNGIPPERVRPDRDRLAIRSLLGVAPDELVILSAGRLAPQKGLEYLMEALPVLERQLPQPFSVWLAGEGPLEAKLRALAAVQARSGRVRFLGFREDIGNLLEGADLIVLPTLREGLSIALIEAMAAGKPVIATSIGSNCELTGNGAAGLLVPPEDPAALATAIRELAVHPERADQLGQEARRRYLSFYTLDQMLDRYKQEYLRLLSNLHPKSLGSALQTAGN
ncbi:MAG: glycosyltransferase family 1 protein [Acidobacteria bacterium]|nr:MAG: glycosyltransferase family 1 protein [Acidobacteriota bacterium]